MVVGVAGWLMLSMYSRRGTSPAFEPPVRELLEAGLSRDSARLGRLDLSPQVTAWALQTGRDNPGLIRALLDGFHSDGAMHNGQRTAVFFGASGFGECSTPPLTVFFADSLPRARLVDLTVNCTPGSKPAPPN